MSKTAVRLALIGAGRWGRNCLRTIKDLTQVQLTAVASRNPATAELVPPDCRVFQHWQNVIEEGRHDAVIIATPPSTHAEILIAAIHSGKAVLIEKPVCLSRAESARIRSILDQRTADILVDHIHLFHPAFRELQHRAQTLGPVRSIAASAGNHGPYRDDVSALWDWAPHDLAMCLTLVPGTAKPVHARRIETRVNDGEVGEDLTIELKLNGNVPAHIRLSTIAERHRWFAVEFSDRKLIYRDRGLHPLVELPPKAAVETAGKPIAVGDEPPLTRAILDLCSLVHKPTGDRTSIDLGLEVVSLIEDIEAAWSVE